MDNLATYPELIPVFNDIETIIGKDTYDMWLRPVHFVYENTTLKLSLPNQFWGKTIRERYQHIITDAFLKHLGVNITVIYQVSPENTAPTVSSAQDVIAASPAHTVIKKKSVYITFKFILYF